jgi:hypothetical protein
MLRKLARFLHPRFQTLFLEYKVDFKPRYGHGLPAHPGLLRVVESNRPEYANWMRCVSKYTTELQAIRQAAVETDNTKPGWNNGFLPGLDIMALYTIIAETKPARYVEVGSGNSTRVAYKAVKEHFENADIAWLTELEPGDILFIDNSHRMLPNSDSMVFYLETLPLLKPGVIVHIHDIYIPFDYPQFMCDRFYSEQYGLAINLLANPQRYHTVFPAWFIAEDKELSDIISDIWNHPNLHDVERHGGSYWLKIQ